MWITRKASEASEGEVEARYNVNGPMFANLYAETILTLYLIEAEARQATCESSKSVL